MLRNEAKIPTAQRTQGGEIQIYTPKSLLRDGGTTTYSSLDSAESSLKRYDKTLSRFALTSTVLAFASAGVGIIGALGMGKLDFINYSPIHNLGHFFHSDFNLVEAGYGSAGAVALGGGSLAISGERREARREYNALQTLKQEESQK